MARLLQMKFLCPRLKFHRFLIYLLLNCFTCSIARAVESKEPKPAELKISGYGIFGNRELKRILTTLELGGKKPKVLSSSFVEDAALILLARIKRDGFLQPEVTIGIDLEEGGHIEAEAEDLLENPLPVL